MKKLLTLFTMLLLCIGSTWAQYYYKPVRRVTTFESGKSYMLYNTCVTDGDNRTGFIYVNGNAMQKNVGTRRNPKQFTTASTAYLWRVTTGSDNHVAIQNVLNSKYYGQTLGDNDNDPGNLYLYPWGTLPAKQSNVKSQNEDDPTQSTASADITFADNKVFVIGGTGDGRIYWNGNPGDIVKWDNGHPFAFYEVEAIDIPSGYNVYTGASTTLNESGWKTQSNWSLNDNWKGNGPGYNSSDMWSPIYLNGVTATGINLEGWTFRAELDHSTWEIASIGKIQGGQAYTNLKNSSTVTMNFGSGHTENYRIDLSEGTDNIFNLVMTSGYKHNCNRSECNNGTITVNYGTICQGMNRKFNASGTGNIRNLALQATLADPSAVNTVESYPLVTYTSVGADNLTVTLSGTDGWTEVTSQAALEEQPSIGKYYYVDKTSTGVTLYTFHETRYTVTSDATLSQIASYDTYDGFIVKSGVTLTVDVENFDLTKIEGEGNVVLAASTSLTGNKATVATGKLTVNAGKTLTIGGGDTQTNSVSSFTSIDLLGTIKNINSTTTLNSVTVPAEATGIIYSHDMGSAADGFRLAGTTTVNGTFYVCNKWNFQMKVDELTGNGTWTICGTTGNDFNASGTSSSEAATINVADSPDFTGSVNMNSTNATTNVNGTLQANTIAGSGKLAGTGTVRLLTFPGTSAPNLTGWTGTVELPEAGGKGNLTAIFNAWGNANSTINVNNVTGWFVAESPSNLPAPAATVNPTLNILSGATLTVNDGYSNKTAVLTKVTGAGTLATVHATSAATYTLNITTLTDFTGILQANYRPIVVKKLVRESAPYTNTRLFKTSASNVTLEKLYIGLQETTAYSWAINTVDDVTGIYVTDVNLVQLAREDATNTITPYYNYVGTDVGKYTVRLNNVDYTDINDVASAIQEWNLPSQIPVTIAVNLPESGKFYKLKGSVSNKYAYSKGAGTQMGMSSTESDYQTAGLFYFNGNNTDGFSMLNYKDGLYVYDTRTTGQLGNSTKFQFAEPTTTHLGTLTIYQTTAISSNGRWMYDNGNNSTPKVDRNSDYAANNCDWYISEVTSIPVTFKTAGLGYATFYSPVAVQIPENTKAYVCKIGTNGNTLTFYEITSVVDESGEKTIPANTPVLLYNSTVKGAGSDVTVSFPVTTIDAEIINNSFVGTLATEAFSTSDSEKDTYSLRTNTIDDVTKVGFYKKTSGTTLAGFKAWLQTAHQDQARNFTIYFNGEDDATGIAEALGLDSDKVEVYDLNGRKLSGYQKGINIVNGKKIFK